ncbi:hypothetical protein ABT344_29440 [Micromonospora carbonacea]|uniref:hypothetical protein n=1 Tax=Micromonospora carbonacea TaxID=47853 RepID=UPI00331B4065
MFALGLVTCELAFLGGGLEGRCCAQAHLHEFRDADRQAAREHLDNAYAVLSSAGIPERAVALARTRRWLEHTSPHMAESRAQALALLWQQLPAAGRPLPELANWFVMNHAVSPWVLARDGTGPARDGLGWTPSR